MANQEHDRATIARLKGENQRERELRLQAEAATAALRESEDFHRLIFENVRDFAIFSTDVEGRITKWNPGAENFFGYAASEVLGQPMDILYTPEDTAKGVAHQERTTAAQAGSARDERWHLRKDGNRLFALGIVNALLDDTGRLRGFIKVARDITERKQMQDRLQQNEELHRLILQNVRDFAIFTFDFAGVIETWNPGAENVFGYKEAEILGQNVALLYTPEDRATGEPDRERVAAMEKRQAIDEHWHLHKDGRRIFVTGAVRPLFDPLGNLHGFAKVARDISSRKVLEQQLEQANQNLETLVSERTERLQRTVGELEAFSYSLSHDMRAPLRAMQSFAEILLSEYGESIGDKGRDYIQRITRAAGRLDRLILDVLTYGQLLKDRVQLVPTDLDKLIGQIVRERPKLHSPNTTIEIESPLLPVMGHDASLTQCLSNLLDNAVKFVSARTSPKLRIWTEPVGQSQVRLWVQDNGIGIEKSQHEKIFEMFHRLHHPEEYEGTGIGLAIVRKAAERMHGQVGVQSEPGQGSRFWLQLARGTLP